MTDMTPQSPPQTDAPQPRIPLGALFFAAFLAVAMGAYAFSILDTARRVTDWLLIAPVAAIGIICLASAALDDWRQGRLGREPAETNGNGPIAAALVVIVLGYAASIPWIGFDIGTAIFVAVTLILQGERRAQVVVPMSLLTAVLLVWVFRNLLGVPLPSTLI